MESQDEEKETNIEEKIIMMRIKAGMGMSTQPQKGEIQMEKMSL